MREARQIKHTFVLNPPLPRPPKPKPVTNYSASQEAALDTSEAHYIKVRWAAKDALEERLRKKREAIAAARQ